MDNAKYNLFSRAELLFGHQSLPQIPVVLDRPTQTV